MTFGCNMIHILCTWIWLKYFDLCYWSLLRLSKYAFASGFALDNTLNFYISLKESESTCSFSLFFLLIFVLSSFLSTMSTWNYWILLNPSTRNDIIFLLVDTDSRMQVPSTDWRTCLDSMVDIVHHHTIRFHLILIVSDWLL